MSLELIKDQNTASFHSQEQGVVYEIKWAWEAIILSLSASASRQVLVSESGCLKSRQNGQYVSQLPAAQLSGLY